MKRGQVTVFVILGIFLVVILFFTTYFISDLRSFFSHSSKENYISYDYLQDQAAGQMNACVSSSLAEAVFAVSASAGYVSASPDAKYGESGAADFVVSRGEEFPVVLDSGGVKFLDDDDVSQRICRKAYVDANECFNSSRYEESGFEVSTDDASDLAFVDGNCRVVIKNETVILRMNYSLSLKKDDFAFNLTSFSSDGKYRIKQLRGEAIRLAYIAERNNSMNESCGLPSWVSLEKLPGGAFKLVDSESQFLPELYFGFAFRGFDLESVC